MTLLLPELQYKYLHFKTRWLQAVNLSWTEKGTGGGGGVWDCPPLKEKDFKVIKPLLL